MGGVAIQKASSQWGRNQGKGRDRGTGVGQDWLEGVGVRTQVDLWVVVGTGLCGSVQP